MITDEQKLSDFYAVCCLNALATDRIPATRWYLTAWKHYSRIK